MNILGCTIFESKQYFFVERKTNEPPRISTISLGFFDQIGRWLFNMHSETHLANFYADLKTLDPQIISQHQGNNRFSVFLQKVESLRQTNIEKFRSSLPKMTLAEPRGVPESDDRNSTLELATSNTNRLYGMGANRGVFAQGGMFGDAVINGQLVELDRDRVETREIKENENKYTEYRIDQGRWQRSTPEGSSQPLPYKVIRFNHGERASYAGNYQLDPQTGLPRYKYAHIKMNTRPEQKPDNPVIALGKAGPNHAGDSEVFRFNEKFELQLATIGRANEAGIRALTGGMKDHGELSLKTAIREFKEEAQAHHLPPERARALEALVKKNLEDLKNWTFICHDINSSDFRNTRHSWMETAVYANLLPQEDGLQFQLSAGDDAVRAQWTTINSDLIDQWTRGNEKLFSRHSDFVALTLLNKDFQNQLLNRVKNNKVSTDNLMNLFMKIQDNAHAFGLSRATRSA